MKKIFALSVIFVLLGAMSAVAQPISVEKTKPVVSVSGSFVGEIGYPKSGQWTKVGDLSGTYEQKTKFYKFDGNWQVTINDKTASGTMQGIFGKHTLYGRITISESGKKAPIIGFIGFNQTSQQFAGRFMSIVGPALYFKGTYQ